MSFGLPDLADAINRFMEENLPGMKPQRIAIYIHDQSKPIVLPVLAPSARLQSKQTSEDEPGDLPDCLVQILETLRQVGRPLTKDRLMLEMKERGFRWSERTVDKYLGRLMENGTIENPAEAKPRGYRLAD